MKVTKRQRTISNRLWSAMHGIGNEMFVPAFPETIVTPQEWLQALDEVRRLVVEYETRQKAQREGGSDE